MIEPPAWLDEYLDECWAAQKNVGRDGAYRPLTLCRWCNHPEHGMACRNDSVCKCETSYNSRDDSWRPDGYMKNKPVFEFMDRHGVDGFVAAMAHPGVLPAKFRRMPADRVRKAVTGG